jgi:hypothetical protein
MANAFAAKSTVTSAVMSATENWSPATKGESASRASRSERKFATRSLLRSPANCGGSDEAFR